MLEMEEEELSRSHIFTEGEAISKHYEIGPRPPHNPFPTVTITLNHLTKHHDLPVPIRHMYTAMAFAKATTGISNIAANMMLEQMTTSIELASDTVIEDKTYNVRTALSRLGVLPDDYLTRYLTCPNNQCWHLEPYINLYKLQTPTCPECEEGVLYDQIGRTRTPTKIIPYTPLSLALATLLQDRQFRNNLQEWRQDNPDDTENQTEVQPLDPSQPYWSKDELLDGLSDGSAWRSQRMNVRRVIRPDNSVADVPVTPYSQRHVGQLFGLNIILNIDWFRVKGVINSSVGAVYACVANLPRHLMFQKRYTALLCVIPGPQEPPGLCLNKILEPIIDDFQLCERGFDVTIPYDPVPKISVSARLLLTVSDLPATRKLSGAMGLSHKEHPCQYCDITKADIDLPSGYDWRHLPKHASAATKLQAAFQHEVGTPDERLAIEETYGVRYSSIARLIGFEHAKSCAPDPLHNSFLGQVRSFVTILMDNQMFEGDIEGTERIDIFASYFENTDYPGHLGRIPNRIARQLVGRRRKNTQVQVGSALTADQWKRISQLLPGALFAAWRSEGSNIIPDEDMPSLDDEDAADSDASMRSTARTPSPRRGRSASLRSHSSRSSRTRSRSRSRSRSRTPGRSRLGSIDTTEEEPRPFRRNRAVWYRIAVSLCAGLRILHAHSISIADAEGAVEVSPGSLLPCETGSLTDRGNPGYGQCR
ncbi:hypothetical protein FFLO_06536 [Filobasidium floriforme]|uniref:Uncharacterized protein n=1 Tax=Filobasidium floriforme TaxID=5210 RepID=A0A8K0NKG6_9TREE|nr:hypothetical protein FFLO_06536 [Filobasidium floriforme]